MECSRSGKLSACVRACVHAHVCVGLFGGFLYICICVCVSVCVCVFNHPHVLKQMSAPKMMMIMIMVHACVCVCVCVHSASPERTEWGLLLLWPNTACLLMHESIAKPPKCVPYLSS